jgi:AraC-like DNA-binding protein
MATLHALNADEWRDIASNSFVPLSFQRAAAQFTASMDHRQLSHDVSLSRIETQALIIDRTPRLIAQSDSDDIHISLQVNAGGSIIQNGHMVPVGPGVVTVCETNKPFTLNYTEPNQRHIVLQTSRAALGVEDSVIEELAGRQITRANPARDAFASFVSSFMANKTPFPEGTLTDMSGVLTSLAAAMLRTENAFSRAIPDHGDALYATMIDFIQANLSSPMLTPEVVAQAHFISRRRMYEVFEAFGETPSELIRSERLKRAAITLRDPEQLNTKIADIAFGMGFNDVTTFTRAFTRHFGMTPREYRAT